MQLDGHRPAALTIAGSDSGGGAGLQADLKTFEHFGVHGVTVVTCVTAQNPDVITNVNPCSPGLVRKQLEAVCSAFRPKAAKTGMLHSGDIIRAVARELRREHIPVVVDPVITSTSGTRLTSDSALRALKDELLPITLLLMPNLEEAERLLGRRIRSEEAMRAAARQIHRAFGCAALVKGGHLKGSKEAVDIFYDGKQELLLRAPFRPGFRTHGTGCTYSAAVTACLSLGLSLPRAVERAKTYISQAIWQSRNVNGYWVLNHSVRQ